MRENSATTPVNLDQIPLPAGATPSGDGWAFWDNKFRMFRGAERVVLDDAGEKVAEVETGGTQLPSGCVDTAECPPTIDVYVMSDDGLTAVQALALAAHLVSAAVETNGWTS
jgi:hypothetical protein